MKIFGIILVVLVAMGATFGLWFNRVVSQAVGQSADRVELVVEKGDGVKSVADKLVDAKLVRARWHWNLYIALTGKRSSILVGEYELKKNQSIREIARIVTTAPEGDREVEVKLLEGWTANDMADVFDRAGVIDAAAFLDASSVTDSRTVVAKEYAFLADKPATAKLEGYLFPDTYKFFLDSSPTQVLQKFLDNFNLKFTAAMRTALQNQDRTIFETVILASILERELRVEADMALAADLFLRRIEAGIALQADATVLYALGRHTTAITAQDLQVDSPYNTYRVRGLPPGPIGNPGLKALRAAVNPTPNDYWYYLSGSDGKTHFAKTLEEHNQNKAKYLR